MLLVFEILTEVCFYIYGIWNLFLDVAYEIYNLLSAKVHTLHFSRALCAPGKVADHDQCGIIFGLFLLAQSCHNLDFQNGLCSKTSLVYCEILDFEKGQREYSLERFQCRFLWFLRYANAG